MKKRFSKIAFLLVLIFVPVIATFGFSACSCSDKPDPEPPANVAVVTINRESASVPEYETITLASTAENTVEPITWTSSDESVATVDGGVVYGVKAGSAAITASAGGASATCAVTVTETINVPVIAFNGDISLEEGQIFSDEIKVKFNGRDITDEATIEVAGAGETANVCTVQNDADGKVVFTAGKVGTAEFIVAVTARGIYVSKNVTVRVSEANVNVFPDGDEVTVTENGYAATLSTTTDNGKKTEIPLTFTAVKGDNVTEKANIAWDLSSPAYDPSVATVSGSGGEYVVRKAGAGKTKLVGAYVSGTKKIPVEIEVTVERTLKNLTIETVVEANGLATLPIHEAISETIVDVTLRGESVFDSTDGGVINLKKDRLPKKASELGPVSFVVSTENYDYVCETEMYSLVIGSKADLDAFAEAARANGDVKNTGVLDGYFVMDADVSYNGTFVSVTDTDEIYEAASKNGGGWMTGSAKYGFRGVFDGRGHNIEGLTVRARSNDSSSGGFVGYLNDAGVVKNVSFTDAGLYENSGFICSLGGGTVENVNVTFAKIGVGNATKDLYHDSNNPRKMGAFFTFFATESATVRNCLVDAIGAEIHYEINAARSETNVCLGTGAKNTDNFVVITDVARIASESGATTALSYEDIASNESVRSAFEEFDKSFWQIAGNMLLPKSVAGKIDLTANIAFADVPPVLYGGNEAKIVADTRYAYVTAAKLPEGVTFANGILTAGETAESGNVTLTVTSLLNGSTATATISTVKARKVTVNHARTDIEKRAEEIDLSFAGEYLGDSAEVFLGSVKIGGGAVTNGKVPFDGSKFGNETGEKTLTVYSETGGTVNCFDMKIRAVTMIIRLASDLDTVRIGQRNIDAKESIGGLYVLGNDIDLGGVKIGSNLNYSADTVPVYESDFGFVGTFEGGDHTISNFTVGKGGLFGHVGKGAVISGFKVKNVKYSGDYLTALFGVTVSDATIDNIVISVANYYADAGSAAGIIASRYMKNCTISGVEIKAETCDVDSIFGWSVTNNKFVGVTAIVKSFGRLGYSDDGKTQEITSLENVTVTLSRR